MEANKFWADDNFWLKFWFIIISRTKKSLEETQFEVEIFLKRFWLKKLSIKRNVVKFFGSKDIKVKKMDWGSVEIPVLTK